MKDEAKATGKMMRDLEKLRRRVASLEASETRLRQAEADLETELNKFQALYELAVAMREERGLNENLFLVVTKGRELLGGDVSYIALRDDRAGDVYMHTLSGIRSESFKKLRIPFGVGLGGKIATTGKGYLVGDYFREIEPMLHETVRSEGLVSGVAVPIQTGRTNLGVLNVFNRRETLFTESDLDTLSLLGNLAAIEIAREKVRAELKQAHADLERRVKDRTNELQKSNEQLKQEINQRKLAQEALKESEEKYRAIWQNAHEGIFIAAGGKFRFLNPAIVRMIGHPLEELLSKPFTAFIHPDDGAMVLERHYKRLRGEAIPSRYPFRMVDPSGKEKWVEIDSALIAWEGEPAALGFMTDITERRLLEEELWKHRHHLKEMVAERTAELKLANRQLLLEITERKKADEALRRNEQMLSNILSASPIGISYFEGGKVKWTNQAMVEIFGEDRQKNYPERRLKEFYSCVDEYRRVREIFFYCLKEGKPAQADAKFRRTGGSVFDGQINISALDPSKPKKGTIITISDISARKDAEKALRESEEKYRSLYEESVRAQEIYESVLKSSADSIVIYDTQGRAKYVSDSFTKMFGWTLQEVENGQSQFVPQSEQEVTKSRINSVLREGIADSGFETKRFTKDGRLLDTSISASRYHDHEGDPAGILVILRDITEQKRAEDALAQSEKQLRLLSAELLTAQEKERKRVAQELHDGIGQSLTAIKFKLENALNQTEGDGSNKESLRTIIPVIQNAIEEVRRISMDLRPSILDDLGILATITWFCREFQTIYSGIQIEKQIDLKEHEVPKRLKTVIFRVLQEALNNVAKHSCADTVQLHLRRKGREIELAVQDNGVGFDPGTVFSPEIGRRGFGLASMKERTESRGGRFEIVTDNQYGTFIRALWPGSGRRTTRK
jgi:PAS domain S-box-containing protein